MQSRAGTSEAPVHGEGRGSPEPTPLGAVTNFNRLVQIDAVVNVTERPFMIIRKSIKENSWKSIMELFRHRKV